VKERSRETFLLGTCDETGEVRWPMETVAGTSLSRGYLYQRYLDQGYLDFAGAVS
jgi:hypothetical protein